MKRLRMSLREISGRLAGVYRCGVESEDIYKWMTVADALGNRSLDRSLEKLSERNPVGTMGAAFCGDCHPPYQAVMEKHGRCMRSLFIIEEVSRDAS